MECKQVNLVCCVDCIGMGMIMFFGYVIGDVMNGDDFVKQNQKNKN